MISEVYNEDCVNAMQIFADNHFDLAVVDVPYTNDYDAMKNINSNMKGKEAKQGNYHYNSLANAKPTKKYWDELFRISKNQIVWGGNYFTNVLPISDNWVVWKKMDMKCTYKPFELAWTSLGKSLFIDYLWAGMWQQDMKNKEKRIHPTQKPIQVYRLLYETYLPKGGKVIDTHLGSGSNRIAADKAGNIDFTAYEIDKKFFNDQEKRYNEYKQQLVLW